MSAPPAANPLESSNQTADPDADALSDYSDDTHSSRDDHVLQIIFDPQVQSLHHRHKPTPTDPQSPRSSFCFVHALLKATAAESAANSGAATPVHATPLPFSSRLDKLSTRTNKLSLNTSDGVDGGEGPGAKPDETVTQMTKTQLSDMVLGVRSLSKHLASLRLHVRVRSILLLTKAHDAALVGHTRTLTLWLLRNGYDVYVERGFRECRKFGADEVERKAAAAVGVGVDGNVQGHGTEGRTVGRLLYWTRQLCREKPHMFDFVVTLGGDGTVLYASWLFQKVVPPVLSFALGSLGFLTKFDFEEHERILRELLRDGVTIGLRLRFEGTIYRTNNPVKDDYPDADDYNSESEPSKQRLLCDEISHPSSTPTHTPIHTSTLLNELVVDRGPGATLITTELFADNLFLTPIAADGICIATPTGSTAYNLAAGGSLCHPELPAILVSVICAHSLTLRPLVLPDSMVIRVGVPYNARTSAWVSFDGRERRELQRGDYVAVRASVYPFPAVQRRVGSEDWFGGLRGTMGWGVRGGGVGNR